MASPSRTTQFTKIFKVLQKHYEPVAVDLDRPVLEHLLLACCLEDAHYAAADEAFAALVHTFFDWNEIRVTTISELAEVMTGLPDPKASANRLKRVLQSVFEAAYAFDLEDLRKKNLGPTVKWVRELDGSTEFVVSYLVQTALGGHSLPIDSGVLGIMQVLDLVSKKDVRAVVVPGIDRSVAKSKGIAFGSLLHQFAADFTANPYSPTVRKILLEMDPGCKERLPKRRAKKPAEDSDKIEDRADSAAKSVQGTQSKKKAAGSKKTAEKSKPGAAKKASGERKTSAAKEKPAAKKSSAKTAPASRKSKKKSASERLAKRKPR